MTSIQKIRMQGFKSFAKLTEMVFPIGYSCIIGSNGSGKSNVCDSICFVLGKSSAKELRAEKSANLIYNGGKNNNPSKEAVVDIYFDNKGEFAIKDDPIKISRIVRHNGQSIYKLNDKVVTRQQIVDLLSTASIDPDGHSIILQGDIIRFAEMKPDDRRGLIEEIAGISVYEDKKEKSLRELEKVGTKLNEAEIILAERSANLRELKKDRDQAIRYKDLEKNIKDNKASLIYLQIENRNSKKNEIEEKIKKEEESIKKLQDDINKYREEINKIKSDIKGINFEMDVSGEKEQLELRNNIEELKTNIARTEERINICKNELEKIGTRSKQIKSDSSETTKKIKDLKEQKELFEKKIVELADKNAELSKQINVSKSKYNSGSIFVDRSINFVIDHNDKNVYGTVGDLTRVDSKYALAIEVAAGNRMKSIVVEDDQTAAKYIRTLKEKKIGTVTFLPLNKIRPINIGNELRELSKKTVGLAIDLVKFDSKFKNIFSYVFGSTLVVNDIEEARKIGIGNIRMSTLEGDLIETSGAMIGGYRTLGNMGRSKLSLKEDVDVESLEAEHLNNEKRMFEVRAEIRNINLQIENMFIPETNKSEKILKEQEKEKEHFTKELNELQEIMKDSKNRLKENIDKENNFHNKFKDLGVKRNKFSDQIQNIETKIIKEEEKIKTVNSSVNVLNITRAKIIGELEGLEKEFEEFKDGNIKKTISIDELTLRIREEERELSRIGNVNLRALEVYENIEKEYNELLEKKEKLNQEKEDVLNMINEIEQKKTGLFMETFDAINSQFKEIFSSLSTKGSGHLELENPENPLTSGVDIKVKVVGNKFLDIRSLSGGEKTLTALAFIFSIQEFKPASFYLLDEVDAALDKANSDLLSDLISKYSKKAQYILISHNDGMISKADQIYGVTMQEGVSKIVSLKV